MNSEIRASIDRIADQARGRYLELVIGARKGTENAAGMVKKSKGPVQALSRLGLKLAKVSYRATDRLLKQQTKLVENQIDAFAGNLHAAAGASGLRNLLDTQVRRIPENTARFVGDTRDAFGVLADAGREAGNVLKDSVVELRAQRAATPARRTAGRTPGAGTRKPAGKTVKKTPSRATAAKKATKTGKRAKAASKAA